jgi:hypothetical protein
MRTNQNGTGFGPLCATFLIARLAPCPGAALMGAILAPGRRTVSSALRTMGLDQEEEEEEEEEKRFHRYHRVLNRASCSSQEASRVLLGLLVKAFLAEGDPLVVGIDETLERRWGKKIAAKGVSTATRCVPPMRTS